MTFSLVLKASSILGQLSRFLMNSNKTVIFFGIGVQKSATTWIFNNLLEHPEICGPEMKETGFFMNKYSSPFETGERRILEKVEDREIEDFEKLFSGCGGRVSGEFTPGYLFYPESLPAIKEYNSEAKIIICLRNPVDRAFSHYLNEYYRLKLDLGFKEASDVDDEILRRGLYGGQIGRLFEIFPKNQVFICFYEDVFGKPDELLKELYSFLGVDDGFQSPLIKSVLNRRKDGLRIWARFAHMTITPLLRKIGLGGFIKNSPKIRALFNKLAKKKDTKRRLSESERSWLLDYYKEDLEKLSSILDKDFSTWK